MSVHEIGNTKRKFAIGDKVVWRDKHYAEFIESRDPDEILTVSGFDEYYIRFEEFPIGAFIHRFEKLSESIQNPHLVGKTAMKNDDLCEDKQTPTFGDNDENMWFKRGELPPVGTVCEVDDSDDWHETVVVGLTLKGMPCTSLIGRVFPMMVTIARRASAQSNLLSN